ncbi:MAG: SagB/ThcOx family dehydrogenase [Candidatus Beckwithbacteria bacterium]
MKLLPIQRKILISLVIIGVATFLFMKFWPIEETEKQGVIPQKESSERIKLPEPKFEGKIPVEKAIRERRSVRDYQDESLSLPEISQLLWAAQGITSPEGLRTVPSAGALYPLEIYLVVGKVEGLPPGVYKYQPKDHQLVKVVEGDKRDQLSQAALNQTWIKEAPVVIVISAVYERTTAKYGERGIRYVYMEVGHAGQNIYLQAVALDLGTVTVGAFSDEQVKALLQMAKEEQPLYLMPVGRK